MKANTDSAKSSCADTIAELEDSLGWEQIYEDKFFQRIADAGFNRATLKQAFVLGQIVEELGPISVRGAFYRAVSAGAFPDTGESYYRTTINILLKLRRRGCISYRQIVDSTRKTMAFSSWSGLGDFMDTVRNAYRKDLWSRQRDCVEFFVEKDAMAAVLEPAIKEYDVRLHIIRGDISETFVWNIAEQWSQIAKPISVYYLGDHDPAGLRIEKTLETKLRGFCHKPFAWERLAIRGDDFLNEDIPGFPIKGDRESEAWQTKHRRYLAEHGDRCVEVDALHPAVIRERVKNTIEAHIDQGEWARLKAVEAEEKNTIEEFVLAQKGGR